MMKGFNAVDSSSDLPCQGSMMTCVFSMPREHDVLLDVCVLQCQGSMMTFVNVFHLFSLNRFCAL